MPRLRPLLLAASVVLLAGCRDTDPIASRSVRPPARDAAITLDGDTAASAAVPVPARPTVFLPPVAAGTSGSGEFDAGLAPVVEVCAAEDTSCSAPVARFTSDAGPGAEAVRAEGGHYIVNWHTGASGLVVGSAYRLRVMVDGTEAAVRLLRVVANGSGAANVGPDELAVVNGRTLPIKFRIQKVRRLSVVVDSGVAGSPPQQDAMYAFGAQVAYAYQAAPGHHGLVVTVDGHDAPASGTLSMDIDHVVTASAEADRTVPAGGEPLVASARAILTASDKPAAFQHHLNLVADVYDRMALEDAAARMDSIYAIAYDPVADSAAIRVAQEALANRVFSVQPTDGAAASRGLRSPRAALLGTAPAGRVTYFTVNGVLTDPASAADNLVAAQKAARDAGVTGPSDDFRLFYNASFRYANNGGLAVKRCFDKALGDHSFVGYLLLIPRLVGCSASALGRFLLNNDLTEAAREVLNVTGTLPIGAEPDSRAWADTLRARLEGGHDVIVMPHSQGNLVTQEALKLNRQDAPGTQSRLCVGVVSAASPASGHFLLRPSLEQGLYVRYDFILWLPFTQGYPQIETDKSRDAHDTWSKWYWRITGLSGPIEVFKRVGLHSFTDSYLGARQSRDYITSALRSERQTLVTMPECAARVATVEVTPPSSSIDAGATTQLTATARDASGNVLSGRAVAWTSSDPSVATVSATGLVHGVGPGSARITATVDTVQGSAQVQVASIPEPSLVLPVGAASSWTVSPAPGAAVTLRFDARLDAPGTAGNSTALEVTVNGVPVTAAALANKAPTYTYTVRGGTELYYQNRGSAFGQAAPYWGLFWSPDFERNNDPGDFYAVAGGQPYTYVLDLTGLVTPGQANVVTLRNHGEWLQSLGLATVIVLRDVSVQ
jgi:hypothetical protein